MERQWTGIGLCFGFCRRMKPGIRRLHFENLFCSFLGMMFEQALRLLGLCHYKGIGRELDYVEAARLFSLAASKNDIPSKVVADCAEGGCGSE